MYIKIIVFYTVVFSLESVLSGVYVDNTSNLNEHHDAQNGRNNNRLSKLLGSVNIVQDKPILLHRQHQNVKNPNLKSGQQLQDSLLPYQQPLDKVQNDLILSQQPIIKEAIWNIYDQNPTSKKFENLHMNVNQHAVTTQRNEKIIKNRGSNHPDKLKVLPFTSLVEDKNKLRTSNIHTRTPLLNTNTRFDLVRNENRQTITPSVLQSLSKVPKIDVDKNKLTPNINTHQKFQINRGIVRQKPATSKQNVINHQGNVQPLRTFQSLEKNVQTNNSFLNKRFAVIHKNGAVEYFDNLEIIIKRYPHITIADNIRKLMPIENPVTNAMTHISNSLANIKINRPLQQNQNLRNENVPSRKIPLHTVDNTLIPRTGNNSQVKNISELNKTNPNFTTLQTSMPIQVNSDDKEAKLVKLETLPIKNTEPRNNILSKSIILQENKPKNLISNIGLSKPKTVVTTKNSSVFNKNDKTTPHKNLNPIDIIEQKAPIDEVFNNGENLSHPQNKTSTLNNKHENSKNNTSVAETSQDLHSNMSKEIISPIMLNEKLSDYKSVNAPKSENHLDLMEVAQNSSLQNSTNSDKNHKTVVDKFDKSQSNDTKPKEVKDKLKTQNLDEINQSVKEDGGDDYDEDFWSIAKPLMWFSTTDAEFWTKLVNVDDAPSFIYVINVQSHPKIEKDRKTTIHANGTIVEEITETVWDAGDDEPKITKTVKVTPANAVVDV